MALLTKLECDIDYLTNYLAKYARLTYIEAPNLKAGALMSQVISANRLKDGIVVYLGAGEDWVEDIAAAAVFAADSDAQAGLLKAGSAVADNVVVDPLIVPVIEDDEGRHATTLRNVIRELGPTIKYKTSPAAAARR